MRCWSRNLAAVRCAIESVGAGEVAGWGVARVGVEVGSGMEMVEGEDSIDIGGIGRVMAGRRMGRVMVMANIVVDCSVVEGHIVTVWK